MKILKKDIWLKILFGFGGIVIVTLTWLRPVPVPEMIINHVIGFGGICMVLVWSVVARPPRDGEGERNTRLKVEIEDKMG